MTRYEAEQVYTMFVESEKNRMTSAIIFEVISFIIACVFPPAWLLFIGWTIYMCVRINNYHKASTQRAETMRALELMGWIY